MGELSYFLGLQVKQNDEGIFISQSKYTKELLKKFGMESASIMKTPMATTAVIDKDESGQSVDQKTYRGIIGSLLYLTASRPDIMFATCICARYQVSPKESHMTHVKRILRYLKGTPELGLWYPIELESGFELTGYSDADFAGCRLDRKSTTGKFKELGSRLISWFSKQEAELCIYIHSFS